MVDKIKQHKKFFLFMVAYFSACVTAFLWLVTPAYGAVSSENEIAIAHAKCEAIANVNKDLEELERSKCKLAFNEPILKDYAGRGNAQASEALKQNQQSQRKLDAMIQQIKNSLPAPAPTPAPVSVPASAPTRLAPPSLPAPEVQSPPSAPASSAPIAPVPMRQTQQAPAGGYRIISAPGQYAAATFDNAEWFSRVCLTNLGLGVYWTFKNTFSLQKDEVIASRIIVLKNGVSLAIMTPKGLSEQVYVDMNNDGRPESQTFYAVDPAFVNDLYVQVTPQDDIQLIWLTSTGLFINNQETVLWKYSAKTHHRLKKQIARYVQDVRFDRDRIM